MKSKICESEENELKLQKNQEEFERINKELEEKKKKIQ